MFVFNGKSSEDMQVLLEEEDDLLGRASQRYIQTDIAGRDGALFEEEGYTVLEKTIKLYVLNPKRLDFILAWLNGVGILEYNNRITKARFYGEANPQRTSSIKTIEMNFIRNPFWLKKNDEYIRVIDFITNQGNIYSEPIIKFVKNIQNQIDITINGIRFKYTFNNDEHVEIDCHEKTTQYNGLDRDRQIEIDYKYPKLYPGKNIITVHSGDAEIYMKRKDCWL